MRMTTLTISASPSPPPLPPPLIPANSLDPLPSPTSSPVLDEADQPGRSKRKNDRRKSAKSSVEVQIAPAIQVQVPQAPIVQSPRWIVATPYFRTPPLHSNTSEVELDIEVNGWTHVRASTEPKPGEISNLRRRVLEECNLFWRQRKSITVSLVTLLYLVLVVFLNLSYLRYQPPSDGRRLKDIGHELMPRLPTELYLYKDAPMYMLMVICAIVQFGTLRACHPQTEQPNKIPYVANIVRRFIVTYAVGHILRALTYLPTTVPGGHDKCLLPDRLEHERPTIGQVFYRTASMEMNCGDEMFSGHMLLCCLLALSVYEYASRIWNQRASFYFTRAAFTLTLLEAILIVAARAHYTSDVVVAMYLTPLLWFQYRAWAPDLEPDPVLTQGAQGQGDLNKGINMGRGCWRSRGISFGLAAWKPPFSFDLGSHLERERNVRRGCRDNGSNRNGSRGRGPISEDELDAEHPLVTNQGASSVRSPLRSSQFHVNGYEFNTQAAENFKGIQSVHGIQEVQEEEEKDEERGINMA